MLPARPNVAKAAKSNHGPALALNWKLFSAILAFGIVAEAAPLRAAPNDWLGTSSDFTDNTNWNGGTAPDVGSTSMDVTFGPAAANTTINLGNPASAGNRSVGGVTFSDPTRAYSIDISNSSNLGINGNVVNATGLTQTFTVTGVASSLTFNGIDAGQNVVYRAESSGSLHLDSTSGAVGGAGARFVLDGGSLTVAGSGSFSLGSLEGSGSVSNTGPFPATLSVGALGIGSIFDGQIANSSGLGLEKIGSGTLTLNNGSNSYAGGTTILGGTLSLGATGALGTSAVTAYNGTTIDIQNNVNIANTLFFDTRIAMNVSTGTGIYSGRIVDIGDASVLVKTGAGTLVLANNTPGSGNVIYGGLELQAGILRFDDTSATSTGQVVFLGGSLQAGASGTLNNNGYYFGDSGGTIDTNGFDVTLIGLVGDQGARTGPFTKIGVGTLTLTNTLSTYSRATHLVAGTLAGGAANVFGNNSAFTIGAPAILDLGGYNQSIGSLSGNGLVTNTGGPAAMLTTGGDNTSTTFAGTIEDGSPAGVVRLTKTGTGTLTLTGTNTHTGGTTVADGVISVSKDANLGGLAGGVTITSASAYVPSTGLGAGSTLQTTSTFTSNHTINFGNFGGRIDTATGTTLTLAGTLTAGGGANFVKQGAGTLVLTGDSSGGFLGTTRVDGGLLRIEAGGRLGSGSAAAGYISDGAAVQVTGPGSNWSTFGQIVVGDRGSGTMLVDSGGTVSSGFSGIIGAGGASSVTITGSGSQWASGGTDFFVGHFNSGALTVADSGALSVSGGTGTIHAGLSANGAAGTINIGAAEGAAAQAAGQLLAGTVALVSNGSSLVFNHTDPAYTFSPSITGTGSLHQIAGTTILTGNNDYSGDTIVDGGKLVAGADTGFSANSVAFVNSGATLSLADGVHTDVLGLFDGASGGGVVNIGTTNDNTTLYVGAAGAVDSDFSGQITGAGSLELDRGSLTLRGASSIGGNLLIAPDATVTLTGPGASFDTAVGAGLTTMGVATAGSLNVLAGAHLSTSNLLVGGAFLVDGMNTKTTVSGFTFVGFMANAAAMTVSGGAVVDSLSGALIENPFAPASAVVTGPGSTWNVSTFLGVGHLFGGGTGLLTVSAGGAVNIAGDMIVASDPTSTGLGPSQVVVTGAGSRLTTKTLMIGLPPCGCGDFLPGELIVADGGSVVVTTGPVKIDQGSTLFIGNGGKSGSVIAPSITNDGAIVADFTDTAVIGFPIEGTGSLAKYNSGTLVLNGANTYTGATTVHGGKLVVGDDTHPGASLTSAVTVSAGASLGGIGTLGGLVVGSGGTVAPGNSIGTLNVAGNIAFDPGSTYAVETNAAGQSDRIAVTGTATLAGGTVSISGPLQLGHRYTILTAGGGVAGTFAGLSAATSSPFLAPALAYDPNSAYLDVVRSGLAFASVGQTPNQIATASALDGMSLDNPLIGAVASLSIDQARSAFDGLSGEVHASTVTALIEDSRLIRAAMNDRLRSAFETVGAAPLPLMGYDEAAGGNAALEATASIASASPATASAAERYGVWGSAFGSWGWTDSDGNAAKLSRSTGGFVTGIDGLVTDDWRLGFLAGYSHSSFKVDDRRSSASSDNYHLGAYGGTQWGALSLRSGLAYTWSDIDSGRSVSFPGFTDALSSSYRTGTTQIFGELGYGMKAGNLAFEPFANLAYVNVHTNAFSEKGGAAALTVRSSSNAITFTTFGLRASTDFDLGAVKATARGMIGWRHGFGDVTPNVTQAFAGSNAFTIAGAPIARESAALEAGFDVALTPTTTLGISYQGQLAANARDHGVRADLNVRF